MKYHAGPRFGLDEVRQSVIYWRCINYQNQTPETRAAIDAAITRAGGFYTDVLRRAVLTRESVNNVALQTIGTNTPIAPPNLCVLVRKVYTELDKTLPP